jgi:antitoxin component YwqK of YwqJK toxin-antitoxin module
LEIEGTYFYQEEENKDDYFIAYRLIVIASDQDNEDLEFEIHDYLKSVLSDENLIFTYIETYSEPQKIVGVPEIQYYEFENSLGWLLEDTNIVDAIAYLKNIKTVNFNDLKSANLYDKKNFKNVKLNEMEESDSNKIVIIKTYYENGEIKEEIETVNDMRHGLYKSYHDNGQLRIAVQFENGNQIDGIVDSFDENGKLIRSVEVRNGNLNGHFKEFYPSGAIKKEGKYKDDEIIGKVVEYFEDGSIKEDNADEYLEGLELDNNKSIDFIDKTAFINKLKNLDESSIIEIRFDSKKWSINEKSIVIGEWNEKAFTLYADVLQKRADLMWEESLGELINLLAKNELGELNNENCKSLYLDSSDGSDIKVKKIKWEANLTDEEEEQFKEEYGDEGSQLYYDGDLEVELFFETGAIIGVRVITEDEEFHLSGDDN